MWPTAQDQIIAMLSVMLGFVGVLTGLRAAASRRSTGVIAGVASAGLAAARYAVYPVYMFGVAGLQSLALVLQESYSAAGQGVPWLARLLPLLFFIFGLWLGWMLERLLPFRSEWNEFGRQEWNDMLHLCWVVPWGLAGEAASSALILTALPLLPDYPLGTFWPARWPLAAQVVLGVVISDFLLYALHRAFHGPQWLWRFHRVHHSCERLVVTRGFRRTFLEALVEGAVVIGVTMLLGVPRQVTVWLTGLNLASTFIAHANIDSRVPRYLNRIFIDPAGHRIHHSVDHRAGNSNFGALLMIFDVLFGTFIDSHAHRLGELGVSGNTLPEGFRGQVLAPFRWRQLDADPIKKPGGK